MLPEDAPIDLRIAMLPEDAPIEADTNVDGPCAEFTDKKSSSFCATKVAAGKCNNKQFMKNHKCDLSCCELGR